MLNKVRVSYAPGGDNSLGGMDPRPGMMTHLGEIASISSDGTTVELKAGSGDTRRTAYPHELFVNYHHATGQFSWPSGDGSMTFGHSGGVYTGGMPTALGSGMAFWTGAGVVYTFGR